MSPALLPNVSAATYHEDAPLVPQEKDSRNG